MAILHTFVVTGPWFTEGKALRTVRGKPWYANSVRKHACAVEMKLMEVNTIEQILDSEKEMVLSAPARYGKYYENAMECSLFMTHLLKLISKEASTFAGFHSQVKKHLMLALFSAVRLHENQSMMNIRYALEAGVFAAYAIGHPNLNNFIYHNEHGVLKAELKPSNKHYDWIKKEHLSGSKLIKGIKERINKSSAHANIISVQNNFQYEAEQSMFNTPFFDIEDDFYVKENLWIIGNVAIILMDLFHNVNAKRDIIRFADTFPLSFKIFCERNEALAAEAMSKDRYKNAMQTENARKDA